MAAVEGENKLINRTTEKYLRIASSFNEPSRGLWAANESISIGYGEIAIVSKATGISRQTILGEMNEISHNNKPSDRTRRKGGRRKDLVVKIPYIAMKPKGLVELSVAGNPQTSILLVSRSLRHLESQMNVSGYETSYAKIGHELHNIGFKTMSPNQTRRKLMIKLMILQRKISDIPTVHVR